MFRRFGPLVVSLAFSSCAGGQLSVTAPVLPLKALHIYETGVGYFERGGAVAAGETTLPVPAGHLDDALKTLVVIARDGGVTVNGFEFAASLSNGLARALAGLPTSEDPVTHTQLLESLVGAEIELDVAGRVSRGRLIALQRSEGATAAESPCDPDEESCGESGSAHADALVTLLVLGSDGAIRSIALAGVQGVRPTDSVLVTRLGAALDALSPRDAQTQRAVRLIASHHGEVTLGYVTETPVWRTSYRLVLDRARSQGELQSWALLHNDTDEDWLQVQIRLINGQPDSFLYPLAAPRYARRELVTPEVELSTVPQLIDTTVDEIWGDHDSEGGGGVSYGHGVGGLAGRGYGSGGGSSAYVAGRTGSAVGASGLLSVGDLAAIPEAKGEEQGALFSFTLAEPLDLRAHGSALVPFVHQNASAELITWMTENRNVARTAALFVNTSLYTLPAGPIAFFADGVFAGESTLDRLKPGERAFVAFGVDLDVTVSLSTRKESTEVRRITLEREQLVEHYMRRRELDVEVANKSSQPRTVFVPLDVINNAEVKGADRLEFRPDDSTPHAVFAVGRAATDKRTLVAVEGMSRSTPVRQASVALFERWLAASSIAATDRDALRAALPMQARCDDLVTKRAGLDKKVAALEEQVRRLQRYFGKAGDAEESSAAADGLVGRVLTLETQLAGLREELVALDSQQGVCAAKVGEALGALEPAK